MSLIEWKEEYRIGIPSVDYEHQELIALLNDLHAGLQADVAHAGVIDFLGEVYSRIAAHFALEERVMREREYDQYAEHKEQHEDLLDDIREIMDDYEDDPEEDYAPVLSRRLQAWFGEHFRTHDARLHSKLHHEGIDFGEI